MSSKLRHSVRGSQSSLIVLLSLWLSNYNRANDVAVLPSVRVCGNRLLERLMSPSPKSQVMFASAFSWICDFFVFLAFIVVTLRPFCWVYEYAWICTHACSSAVSRVSRMIHAVSPSRGFPACRVSRMLHLVLLMTVVIIVILLMYVVIIVIYTINHLKSFVAVSKLMSSRLSSA